MIMLGASIHTDSRGVAERDRQVLCQVLERWGPCTVTRFELDPRRNGDYILWAKVELPPQESLVKIVRSVSGALATGRWEFHEDNPDEPWSIWLVDVGGQCVASHCVWLNVECYRVSNIQ